MSAVTAALAARSRAESRMVDTCTVNEASTSSTMNPDTGVVTVTPGALVYSGMFEVQDGGRLDQESESGGHRFIEQRWLLKFPIGAPPILEGHRVVCTAALVTPQNVGRVFQVAAPGVKSLGKAQSVAAIELVGQASA